MKTALRIMAEEIDSLPNSQQVHWLIKNFGRYLEIEKEQIMKARDDGFDAYARHKGLLTHEQYYNQTYNNEEVY